MSSSEQWDRVADRYDRATAPLERRFLANSRAWACERATEATLDVGIGTGANLPYYPAGVELTGVDISPEMMTRAAARARGLGRPLTCPRWRGRGVPCST